MSWRPPSPSGFASDEFRRFSLMAFALSFSTRSRPRTETLRPAVFRSPEGATIHVHTVIGCDHERDARTRRAVPIKLDTTPSSGTATCSDRTPAPWDARDNQACQAGVKTSTGKLGNSPRRSSRSVQSGFCQFWPPGFGAATLPSPQWRRRLSASWPASILNLFRTDDFLSQPQHATMPSLKCDDIYPVGKTVNCVGTGS